VKRSMSRAGSVNFTLILSADSNLESPIESKFKFYEKQKSLCMTGITGKTSSSRNA
jgi:hypothetical protein